MKVVSKIVLASIVLSFCMPFLTACNNTVKGFGQDMQENGHKIEKSSNDQQK